MPKLGVLSAAEVCRILQKREGKDSCTVPVPNHAEIAKGTLKSIIRLSCLPEALFRK